MNWSEFLSIGKLRTGIVLSFVWLIILAIVSPSFFEMIQRRDGFTPADPLLDILPSIDLSNIIFFILYVLVIVTVIRLARDPLRLLLGLEAYAVMMTIRFLTIYLIRFEPPPGLIALQDPLANMFFYGQTVITKDLFFSGHAATLFLLYFLVQHKTLRTILLAGSVIVSLSLLVQHIHYTYDVLAAPLFAFGSYRITMRLSKIPAQGVAQYRA